MVRWIRLALCLAVAPNAAAATSFEIVQVTDNTVSDQAPAVDGDHIAWIGWVSGSGFQVWHRVGSGDAVQLSTQSNEPSGAIPSVSGERVVWKAASGGLHLFDGTSVAPLPPPVSSALSYDMDGSAIAYTAIVDHGGVYSGDVFLFDGSTSTQITFDAADDDVVELSGSSLAWLSASNPSLPLGYGTNVNPFSLGRGGDVRFYDGAEVQQISINRSFAPSIDGGRIAWFGWDGNDYEIYLYENGVVHQLTDNDVEDRGAAVSAAGVAWYTWDGNDYEIFFHDGNEILQVTDNTGHDFSTALSGTNLVWGGWDGNDYEIYRATVVPEPSALSLAAAVLAVHARNARSKRATP